MNRAGPEEGGGGGQRLDPSRAAALLLASEPGQHRFETVCEWTRQTPVRTKMRCPVAIAAAGSHTDAEYQEADRDSITSRILRITS